MNFIYYHNSLIVKISVKPIPKHCSFWLRKTPCASVNLAGTFLDERTLIFIANKEQANVFERSETDLKGALTFE